MDLVRHAKLGCSLLLFAVSGVAHAHSYNETPGTHEVKNTCEAHLVKVKAEDENYYGGMTDEGHKRLVEAQAALKSTTKTFNANFEGMNGFLEMDLLTIATRENAFLAGPPGGAKSGHLLWLFPKAWVKQMHELMTDAALFGGQTEEGFNQGIEKRNRTGSVENDEVAIWDEWSNANPQLAAAGLMFLNPGERSTTENGVMHKAKTRAVYMTGNATRAEMLKNYAERGLTTGPATLNRAIFKAWVPNWLSEDEQARRDKVIRRKSHLESVKNYGSPEESSKAKTLLIGLESKEIDFKAVEAFATHAVQPHEDLVAAVREFANKFREKINVKIMGSDTAHRENPQSSPLVFTPAAEWTERFRTSLLRVVMFSAALDYLRMAGPEGLNKPIVLGPMSLWRVMYATTTIGPGENRFNPKTMTIDFNMSRNNRGDLVPFNFAKAQAGCKNNQELEELKFMIEEQALANEEVSAIMKTMAKEAKDLAPFMPSSEDISLDLEHQDFEILNYRYLQATRP